MMVVVDVTAGTSASCEFCRECRSAVVATSVTRLELEGGRARVGVGAPECCTCWCTNPADGGALAYPLPCDDECTLVWLSLRRRPGGESADNEQPAASSAKKAAQRS